LDRSIDWTRIRGRPLVLDRRGHRARYCTRFQRARCRRTSLEIAPELLSIVPPVLNVNEAIDFSSEQRQRGVSDHGPWPQA